jgi:molybdenum cofactor synthesis domain-containing protein
MQPGFRLRPQDVGFLSMLGFAQVPVYRQPRIAIFSTGDELVPVEEQLRPGKIHDSNSYTLIAAVELAGGKAFNLGIVADREDKVRDCLDQAVAMQVDLILSSAGVSVGAFDFVRSVVERQGDLDFWRVNMRPGKPLAFGHYQGIPFIGLPGNPVSAFVGFEVFVNPALLKLGGVKDWTRPTRQVHLLEGIESDGRESYLRAVVLRKEGRLAAKLTGHQGSGNLRSLVQANALLVIPAGVTSLPAGSAVEAWALGEIKEFQDDDGFIGLIDSLYLTWTKLANQQPYCGTYGGCETVGTSSYSEIAGIPIAILGAGAYLTLLGLFYLETRSKFWKQVSPLAVFGISLAGVLYSAYLTYIEIAVLKAICFYCVISAVAILLLLVLAIFRLVNVQAETNPI